MGVIKGDARSLDYGSYIFVFQSMAWGEHCRAPLNPEPNVYL